MKIGSCVNYIMLNSVLYKLKETARVRVDWERFTTVKCIKLFRTQTGIEDSVGETYEILSLILFALGEKVSNIKGALYE